MKIPAKITFAGFVAIIVTGLLLTLINCSQQPAKSERVILIGIDGMGISGFQQAKTPHLDQLVRSGALSFKTRGVMPTVSAPNWGSHLLGAGPEQHGITYNGWTVDNHSVQPAESDSNGYFPSVFTLLHQQEPEIKTGFFYDWDALADLFNLEYIDTVAISRTYPETLEKATSWIVQNDPGFTFIYIGYPDEVGHEHQWGSYEYIKALEEVDAAIGSVFNQLQDAGMFDNTTFMVVTDHGGVGHGHGGLSMEELEIPWIISGPGVIQNRMIDQPNNVFNTASTIAWLFDLEQPLAWIGKPVLGAFNSESLSKNNTLVYVPQPTASIGSGLYPESDAIAFNVSDPDVQIRVTLNGDDPGENSPLYKGQVLLQRSTTVKAAGFLDGHRSRVTTVDFVKVVPVDRAQLASPPAEKYRGEGVQTLIDLQRGSADYKDGKWLGFQGDDLELDITMQQIKEIRNVRIGILNLPGSWIFPPESVEVIASVDGQREFIIGSLTKEQIRQQLKSGRNELMVPVRPSKIKYLKVRVTNTGTCPPGHPGEGQPAWLFVDEVVLE